jgi:hypothetical protein
VNALAFRVAPLASATHRACLQVTEASTARMADAPTRTRTAVGSFKTERWHEIA